MVQLELLCSDIVSREELSAYVANLTPWIAEEEKQPSSIIGGKQAAGECLATMDALHYGKTRNYLDGKVTRLSPYIRHGIITLNKVRNAALGQASVPEQVGALIQELAWRDFWQRIYEEHPSWIWEDVEPYKTGWQADDYVDSLPEDIAIGKTGIACLNQFIQELLATGYLHNHARMYLASYIIHWRRIKWQAGARWFLHHLLDGDPASNNLSWQWVASTFSQKPYIFNLENVRKYAHHGIDVSSENNAPLNASYEALAERLFPHQQKGIK